MDELISQITIVARGMWNYRRLGVTVSWLVGAIGMVVVFTMPDRYQASARVYVDTQSILRPLMSVNYPLAGDFMVDNRYIFEVGGKSKNQKQIHHISDSYLAIDGIEAGFANRIPLWLFGFLY